MQMAVTDAWFFKEHDSSPKASIVYMDASERVKLFAVQWDDAAKKAWFEDLLPRACVFYYSKFIPAIKKHRDILISTTSTPSSLSPATALPPSQSMASPTPTTLTHAHINPSPSAALVEIQETGDNQQTPALVPGKVVYDVKQGKDGVIVDVLDGGKKARIDWDGEGPSKKARSAKDLVVKVVKDPILPNLPGQTVIVNTAGRTTSSLVGRKGTVREMKATKCVVDFDDGTTYTIEIKHLHRLQQCNEQPTVQLNPIQRIKANEFHNFIRDYQEKNKTQLLGIPSEESFKRSIEQFGRANNLKY